MFYRNLNTQNVYGSEKSISSYNCAVYYKYYKFVKCIFKLVPFERKIFIPSRDKMSFQSIRFKLNQVVDTSLAITSELLMMYNIKIHILQINVTYIATCRDIVRP